jgi:hypothetical protein
VTDAGARPAPRRRGRPIVFGAAVAIFIAIVVASSVGHRPARPRLPDPNGYDDLARAGSLIQGQWPNKGDLARADPGEVRAFVEANKAALDLARVGLGRECVAPVEATQEGLGKQMERCGHIRSLSRLLTGEAIVREADGHFVEAAKSDRDALALGQALTQGGMGNDAMTGWVIQGVAIARLRKLRDRLPSDAIRDLLRDLESLDRRRVSVEAVEAGWYGWYQGAFSPMQRTMLRWSGVEKRTRIQEAGMAERGRERIERSMRFLLVELAIHAYHEDRKTWPRSIDDLVPAYLASVPISSGTGKAIDYPANAAGDLTDDLSSIARPDGEVSPRP